MLHGMPRPEPVLFSLALPDLGPALVCSFVCSLCAPVTSSAILVSILLCLIPIFIQVRDIDRMEISQEGN